MSETVLVNAATVAAGDPCDVEAYLLVVPPEVDFRIVCDKAYTVNFYVANADFSDVDDAAELSGTEDSHAATTGIVYRIDAGSYDYVAAVVTNEDGADDATVTVAVGFDLVAEAATALFTVAEARAFDDAQLATVADFPSATIIAKEAEIREWFGRIFGVDFITTAHTDEYHDGDGDSVLLLDWPRVQSVTAASYRVPGATTWTALTATELGLCQFDRLGRLVWECGCWPDGMRTAKVSYTAGHATVPARIKRAALQLCVEELVSSNVPYDATSFDAGGGSYSIARADGYADQWLRTPDGMAAYRAYSMKLPGIA
jgi:hypothetical protein